MKREKFENSLINEKSPYLLQHAHNPVNWYPWGEEAFEIAEKENKPVFLSIGYSTCHWCHVMARESFEDISVADLLNENFVAVKVDREERPDVDAIYMEVCQLMTGSGGWPLTIIMTPEGEPFFAGTYFPRDDKEGMPGLRTILQRVAMLWKNDPEGVMESAREIVRFLNKKDESEVDIGLEILDEAYSALKDSFDSENGGFSSMQKFPTPQHIYFLLRYYLRSGREDALKMVNLTLENMRKGGIYDHIGYGFHRYAVEPTWTIPHFEKMLYDQALILIAYLEAFSVTGRDIYRQTASEIVEYVLRDMQSPEGGFYSAEDAESEGVEGKFYIWSKSEILDALGTEAGVVIDYFNVLENGNFIGPEGETGKNILHVRSAENVARKHGLTLEELSERVENARKILFEVRLERPRPSRDDKILTDWNGLMISGLARSFRILGDETHLKAAEKALDFIMNNLYVDGRLMHRYRDGDVSVDGTLDDYAFMVWGLLELYESTFEPDYLKKALELSGVLEKHFMDTSGGFFFTADFAEDLIVRKKESLEGAIPSGNSVHMLNLLKLGSILEAEELIEAARGILKCFSSKIKRAPSVHTFMLTGLSWLLKGGLSLVVACPSEPEVPDELRNVLIPDFSVTVKTEDQDWSFAGSSLLEKRPLQGECTYYLCSHRVCQSPTTSPEKIMEYIKDLE